MTAQAKGRLQNSTLGGMLIYGGLCLLAAALAVMARLSPLFPGDLALDRAIQSLGSPNLEPLMAWISYFGFFPRSLVITLAVAALFWLFRHRLEAVFTVATLVNYPVGLLIKELVARPRPDPQLVHLWETGVNGSSFPSGHVLFATVFFGFLFYVASSHLSSGAWLKLVQGALLFAILGMGISRIYLGAHWPSDVLGGYLIGGLVLAPIVALYRGFVSPRWGHYEMA